MQGHTRIEVTKQMSGIDPGIWALRPYPSILARLPGGQCQRVPCGKLLKIGHTVCVLQRDRRKGCDQPGNAKGPEPCEVSGPACVQ